MVSSSTRRAVIDLTDSDNDVGVENHLVIQSLAYKKEIANLQAQVNGLQTEVLDLRAELEHSQVDLKYAKEKLKNAIGNSKPMGSTISKRPRSPSIECVDPPASKKQKSKMKEEPPISPGKPKLEMCDSIPATETKFKIEKESPKKATFQVGNSGSLRGVPLLNPDLDADAPSTPDGQAQQGEVVPTSLIKSRVAPVTTQTILKVNDSTNPVAAMGPQSRVDLVIRPPPSVPRALLCGRYGVSSRLMILKIKKQHNPSSINFRKLILPDFNQNPDLPLKPGASGFMYSSREDVQGQLFSLFVRCSKSKKSVWRYFGEYKTERCGTMSTQKFCSLSDKVQKAWANAIFTAKSNAKKEYIAMRVRIAKRKIGVVPSDMRKEAKKEAPGEEERVMGEIGEPDILEAMVQGQEHLGIVALTCTSYDDVFAEDLRQTFDMMKTGPITKFIHPELGSDPSNPKSISKTSTISRLKGTSVHSRRSVKRRVEEDSESQDDKDDESGSSEFGFFSDRLLRPRRSARFMESDSDSD